MEVSAAGVDVGTTRQFGARFYPAYLVIEKVIVTIKHNDDKQYVQESKAGGAFAVSEDVWNEPLGRETEIRFAFQRRSWEYLEKAKLKKLMSGGVNSPFRAFKAVGGQPILIDSLKGSHM